MRQSDSKPSREDVLNAFAVELDHGDEALERYIKEFPEFSTELRELSHELSHAVYKEAESLSQSDKSLIESTLKRHADRVHNAFPDPLASLSIEQVRELSRSLEVPRQIIAAFRERKVLVSSIPNRFAGRFAALINTSVELLRSSLQVPPQLRVAGSYKADEKPQAVAQVTFERLLIEAGVSDEKRAVLMAED